MSATIESLRAASRFAVDDASEAVGRPPVLAFYFIVGDLDDVRDAQRIHRFCCEYGVCCALHSYIEDEATESLCDFMDDDADHALASDQLFQTWRAVRPAYDRDADGITEWEILQAIRTAAANSYRSMPHQTK